jgi:hypothetical protein
MGRKYTWLDQCGYVYLPSARKPTFIWSAWFAVTPCTVPWFALADTNAMLMIQRSEKKFIFQWNLAKDYL